MQNINLPAIKYSDNTFPLGNERKGLAAGFSVFTLSGAIILIVAFLMYNSRASFLDKAVKTQGTVLDIEETSSEKSTKYKLVVHFINQNGAKIEFTSSTSSYYSKGQNVDILYLPSEPQNAEINDFSPPFANVFGWGCFGSIFFLIGSSPFIASIMKHIKNNYLRKNGIPIEAEYLRVDLNPRLSVNGRYPFIVLAHWQNQTTSELHIFKSNNLWFDPSGYIGSSKIKVFINKQNPDKYFVDLSFLPELAKPKIFTTF